MVPFLGTQLLNKHAHVETKVYFKPPNTGLRLHYKSHVNDRYKRGLIKLCLIVHLHFHPIIGVTSLSEERDRLKLLFFRLKYPDRLVISTISRFVSVKALDQPFSSPTVSDRSQRVSCCPTV